MYIDTSRALFINRGDLKKNLSVASLGLQELVQNAEDAGARSFKIFYKEGDDVPAPQTSKLSYRSYFRVLKQSD